MGLSTYRGPDATMPVFAAMAAVPTVANAGSGGVFPVDQTLVPIVVAAAFLLPALVAGVVSALLRVVRNRLGLLGAAVVVIGAALALATPGGWISIPWS